MHHDLENRMASVETKTSAHGVRLDYHTAEIGAVKKELGWLKRAVIFMLGIVAGNIAPANLAQLLQWLGGS